MPFCPCSLLPEYRSLVRQKKRHFARITMPPWLARKRLSLTAKPLFLVLRGLHSDDSDDSDDSWRSRFGAVMRMKDERMESGLSG